MEAQQQKRFVDNGDGTVNDLERGIMWKQTDAYQDIGRFMNWYSCRQYLVDLNQDKFAGHTNWRFPTLEEAQSLYNENKSIRDMDRFEIFIDPCFSPGGASSSWTDEERPYGTAVVFFYRFGYEDLAHKDGMSRDTVRAVRTITENS